MEISKMQYYIKTERSYLTGEKLNIDNLLEQCVSEVDGLLINNPEIFAFGKKCNQHRSIGFFQTLLWVTDILDN